MRNVVIVCAACALLAAAVRAEDVRIPVRVSKPASVTAERWPVSFGVPFKQGQCKDVAGLTFVDGKGQPVPCQIVKTADWADGSVRWALVDVQADFAQQYALTTGPRAESKDRISIVESGDGLTVVTGPARYEFNKSGGCFNSVQLDANADGKFTADEALVANAARAFYVVDSKGRRATLNVKRLSVELAGERHAVVRVEGEYVAAPNLRVAAGTVYYHFYAGLPWVRISHKLIVTEDTFELWFKESGLAMPVAAKRSAAAQFSREGASGETRFDLGPGQEVALVQDEFPHFASEKSHFAVTRYSGGESKELASGAACGDWADLSSEVWGLAAQVPAFAETFPKAFRISDKQLTIKLWASESGKELDFRPAQLMKNYFGNDWIPADDPAAQSKMSAKGTARTHEIWLYPHAGPLTPKVVRQFGATKDEIFAAAEPAWFEANGAFGPWHALDTQRFPEDEKVIEDYFNRAVLAGQKIFPATGYLHWGCYPYSCQPWAIKNGRWYPTIHRLSRCLEYNLKRHVWILFARSGDRKYYDYARRYTRLQHDLLWSNWDYDEKYRTRGKLYQGVFASPILWSGRGAYLAYASSEDLIQFVDDYFLAGDYHSRDMVLAWKEAMARDWNYDVTEPLKMFPPVVGLRMIGSAYELDHDPKIYDFGHRLMVAMVDPAAPLGLKPEPKQNYGKMGDVLSVFYYYYVSTGDPLSKAPMLRLADFDYRNGRLRFIGRSGAETYAYALACQETKDPKYAIYLAEHLRHEGHTAETLERMGVDFNALNQKFDKPWGHVTMTGSGPLFVGLPVAMKAALDAGMPQVARPLAIKPIATQKTYLLVKKSQPGAALMEISVNNVGDRLLTPKLFDEKGQPAPLEVVERTEWRDTKPPGVHHYGGGAYTPYYGMHESYLFFKFRIPASAKPGVYSLDLGEEVKFTVLNSEIEQVIQAAPDGLVLKDGRRNCFTVPAGVAAVEFFAQGKLKLCAPDGQEVAVEVLEGPSGKSRFVTAGRAGAWSIETDGDQYVRMGNIPFIVALDDSHRLFEVNAANYPSSEPPGILIHPDPKQPFVASRFGKGVFLQSQLVTVPISAAEAVGAAKKPAGLPVGTVEFWWRPHWSVGDLNTTTATCQRLYLLNLDPVGLIWCADRPTQSDAYYDAGTLGFYLHGASDTRAKFYPVAGKWYHVALTWNVDGKNSEMDVYINGRKRSFFDYHDGLMRTVTPDKLKPLGNALQFGSGRFHGRVVSGEEFDELRISNVVRYKEDFTPPDQPFAQDKDTFLLMHLDGDFEGTLAGKPVTGKLLSGRPRLF